MFLHLVVLSGTFLTVTCLAAALYDRLFYSRKIIRDRLAGQVEPGAVPSPEDESSRSIRAGTYRLLGGIGRVISGRSTLDRLQDKLARARLPIKAEELTGLAFVCALGALFLCWLMTESLLFGAICGAAAFYLPFYTVNRRRRRRTELLNQQLPDALDIITNGLRAGFSFTQALGVLIQEMGPPIAEEFNRVIRKNQLGKPMGEALQELSDSTDSDDLEMVVTALLIQRQVGGNLAEILDNVAHTVRERIRIKGEIKTLTTQGRITALIISLLPPGVMAFIFAINPGYMSLLFTEPLGLFMFGAAVFFQILGILVLRRIINIEV